MMSTMGKSIAIAAFGALIGASIFAWTEFGNGVYVAYLAGAVMRCF